MESKDQMYVTVHGSNRVELVGKLRAAADNLDGTPATVTGKVAKSTSGTKKDQELQRKADAAQEEDDDFKADDSGAPNGFDNDDTAPEPNDADEEEFLAKEEKKAASKKGANGKAKKITIDDVNDACKAHAAAKGRPATLDLLKKKFKTQSVTALKPEQFEACIAAMAVN